MRHIVFTLVFAVAGFSVATRAAADEFKRETFDETGFVSIFDGRTLSGWHVSAQSGHSGASKHTSG